MRFYRTIIAGVFYVSLMGAGASASDKKLCLEDSLRGELGPVYTACSRLLDSKFAKPELQTKYHWRKAEIFYRQQRFNEALEAVELSLALDPTFPPALMRRAYALVHLNRRDEAFVAAKKLLATAPEWSNSSLTLAFLGVFHLTFDQRYAALSRAVKLDPENYLARYGYGSFLIARGSFKEGEAQWQVVLDADPKAVDAQYHRKDGPDDFELYGYMLETRGQHYSATRQPDKALADYTRLIELYPQMARGYYDRARHHLNFDQLGLAEADIAKSLELQRDYSKALELSVSVKFFQKKYQQVIKDADGLLAGETEAPAHLLLYRGYSLREMGRPEEAFESFWSAAKMLPFVASDMKSRMLARGYYSGSEEDSVEDNKFINGLKACAVDPGC